MGSFNTKQDMEKLATGRAVELFERSPLSTAVRGVLFASSATAVLSGSMVAHGAPIPVLPANCEQTNLETVTCLGAVTDNVIPDPINDLTIVIGDALDPDATTLDLTTYSVSGPGVYAQSYNAIGDATVINNSAITTYDGRGIVVNAGNDATIENNGSVDAASSGRRGATGLAVYSENGNATVTNNGSVTANAAWATGVSAYSRNNDAYVYNNGDITVSEGNGGTGIWAGSRYEDATVVVAEGASVTVDAWKYATGVAVGAGTDALNDYAVASIAGTVDVTAGWEAVGVSAGGSDVDIDITATGSVTATVGSIAGPSYSLGPSAEATGIYTEMGVQDFAVVDIAVDGSVSATASAFDYANATGVGVNGTHYSEGLFAADSITISNTSVNSITATATVLGKYAEANAVGIYIEGGTGTTIDVYNIGSVSATATATDTVGGITSYGEALGSAAYAEGILVTNEYSEGGPINITSAYGGTVAAEATTHGSLGNARATGVDVYSWSSDINIANDGAVNATADAKLDDANAVGINAWSTYGDIDITGTTGAVDATATGYQEASATGIDAYTRRGEVYITGQAATAEASSVTAYAEASGISAYAGSWGRSNGNVAIKYSSGDAVAAGYAAGATGIDATASKYGGGVEINNSSASADAQAYGEWSSAQATGIATSGESVVVWGDDTSVTATATAQYGTASATGIEVDVYGWSYIGVGDGSTVDAEASSYGNADATGIDLEIYNWGGTVVVDGGVTATANSVDYSATAVGVVGQSYRGGLYIEGKYSTGSVEATATGYYSANAVGVDAYAWGRSASVSNLTVDAEATATYDWGSASATGVEVFSGNGLASTSYVDVSATATAGYANAQGIEVNSSWYSSVADSSGAATAISTAPYASAGATGIQAAAGGDVWVSYSDGTATAEGAYATAYGLDVESRYDNVYIEGSTGMGAATATSAYGSGWASAVGISAYSPSGDVTMDNVAGTASAIASGTYSMSANATGIDAYSDGGDISITGASATAEASATSTDAYASASAEATGIYAEARYDVSVVLDAADVVSAIATLNSDYGEAYAVGVYAAAEGGAAAFSNAGSISADADTNASGYGGGVAIGADIKGYTVNASNAGDITAMASGYSAWAVGLEVSGYNSNAYDVYGEVNGSGPLTVSNTGGIYATAVGDGNAGASGIRVDNEWGYSDVVVTNADSGVIIADATAVGAKVFSAAVSVSNWNGDYTTIVNDGTITASANGDYANAFAVSVQGGSDVTILNNGTMTGAVYTGSGDDFVGNYSSNTWNATGNSYLGGGDDVVYNATTGRIVMTDATIDLGYYSQGGNEFINAGLLQAFGDNVIDMGNGGANPNAFNSKYGTISLVDGAVDDSLSIYGDFSGGGALNVDVDAAASLSDTLYISGDVSGAPTTVNVNLLTMPTTLTGDIEVVSVGEFSEHDDGDFVVGEITVNPDSFLTFDIEGEYIPPSSPSLFVLDFSTTGLSDPGVLASSLSPAVQSLWQSGVGTLHQRQGAVRDQSLGKLSVWLRTFTTDGTIDPNGAQANLEFDQENKGYEVGVDVALNDQWRVGILAGESEAEVDLNDATGSADIDGDTLGVYLTWLAANDWYADLSYRTMDLDGDAKGGAATMAIDGDADGWNLEVGKTYTLASGLVVEPQFQYTDMEVDLDDIVNTAGTFTQTDGDSSRVRAGVMLRKAYQSGTSKWTPYGSLNVIEELDGENSFNAGAYSSDSDISGTSILMEGGVNAQFGDVIVHGGVNYQNGDGLEGLVGGQLGVRFSW